MSKGNKKVCRSLMTMPQSTFNSKYNFIKMQNKT